MYLRSLKTGSNRKERIINHEGWVEMVSGADCPSNFYSLTWLAFLINFLLYEIKDIDK
jgi:hypothetical protein